MQDLKLIAINTNQTFVALAVQNTGINPVGNTNPIEILLFHNEYNSIVLDYILNSLEKARILRDLEFKNVEKLMEVIHKKSTKQ
tara:strand:+ start:419 stop:670 length:252 start_codon:yes stop_codon:yes gene_type:complete